MKSMFRIQMFPAQHGDCLWIEYGDPNAPSRVLIDAGPAGTWKNLAPKLASLPVAERHFELLVCTHVDADHITGVLTILSKNEHEARYDDVWFNGWKHMTEEVEYGPAQGERLSSILMTRPWNQAFEGKSIHVPEEGPLMHTTLPGGMRLTILSPTPAKLKKFIPKWRKECIKAGLDPENPAEPEEAPPLSYGSPSTEVDVDEAADSKFKEDGAEANGSSIAFLAEFDGRRVIFGADAHPSVMVGAIERLDPPGGKLKVDAFKLPHHASQNNVNRALIEKVDAARYLVSTNGDIFQHPDVEAIARVVKYGGKPEIIFNYKTRFNEMWDSKELQDKWGYRATYPESDDGNGVIIDL